MSLEPPSRSELQRLGRDGLDGLGLSEEEKRLVRRFEPGGDGGTSAASSSTSENYARDYTRLRTDSIGFFIARFRKRKSEGGVEWRFRVVLL